LDKIVDSVDKTAEEHMNMNDAHKLKRPRGRIPVRTKAWLDSNKPDCLWKMAICHCGRWFHRMDRLAPYHTEMNWCPTCGHKQDWNGPDD
jgi:hypothetical protein